MLDARQIKFFLVAYLFIFPLLYAANNSEDLNGFLTLIMMLAVLFGLPWSIFFEILEGLLWNSPFDIPFYLGAAINIYLLVKVLVKKRSAHTVHNNTNKRL